MQTTMQTTMHARSEPARYSHLDLELNVLRHLPTPVLVLSPSRKAIFVNRAAERLFGSPDPIQSVGKSILGQGLAELGVKLLYNQIWDEVLDKLVSAQEEANSEGNEAPIHNLDALVSNTSLTYEDRHFRILVSTLAADDGLYYMLSFERSAHIEKKLILHRDDEIPFPKGGDSVTPDGLTHDAAVDGRRDIARIKKAVFDCSNMAGFIIAVDENIYLTNKKMREVLGDVLGGAPGSDGLRFRGRMEIWDESFTERLDTTEFPGIGLVKARKPFTDYRCGFVHAVTGDKILMNVSGECLFDDATGEFIGWTCWCRDLEEYSDFLSRQQLGCLESHETICNLMPHMVWTTTADGLCDWLSQRWYQFTGMNRDESLGEGFHKAIYPEDLPVLLGNGQQHQELGTEFEVEIRYRRHDGVFRWMLCRACPFRDESGKILKWYGTTTDIHDLVMARIDAARNKLQMLTVLAHAEVSLFSIDKDRVLTMAEGAMLWDSEAESHDIMNKSALIGRDVIELAQQTQPGGVASFERTILDVLSGKVGLAQSEDKIGDRVFRTRVVAELENNSSDGGKKPELKGLVGLTIDVTDMKARAALELDNARLMMEEQAAKDSNRTKSQFLANMSHEMRTPIAGLIGTSELLSEDPNLTCEQQEYVNSIQISARALLAIVNDVLDFSKIESGRLDIEEVPFSLASIVSELYKLFGMFANQKGLEFIYENSMNENLELLGDPGRIRQVLSNLMTNAVKFTKEGMVKLSVSSTTMTPKIVGEEKLVVQFIIEDTGIGIEKHVLEKLFRPFSQGDSSTARLYGGTGLGLTICKNLASLMKGSITLESTLDVGSKATFIVPLKVSSWCLNHRLDTSTSSAPYPRFDLSNMSSKIPIWTQPVAHRSKNQDPSSQQISNSVTSYQPEPVPSPLVERSSRHNSIDGFSNNARTLSAEQRSRIHVLVVEDNAINQTIALKNIQKLGFPVTAVWNGREALSYLLNPSSLQPRPSIILMDVQMPVMDGYEATRILRSGKEYTLEEDSPTETIDSVFRDVGKDEGGRQRGIIRRLSDIPVIAMTASAIQGDREKCYEAGMDDYLAKPVEKAMLEEMLVKWAGRRRV